MASSGFLSEFFGESGHFCLVFDVNYLAHNVCELLLAWQMAAARASDSSSEADLFCGSKILIMASTCCFSARPTPVTDFLMEVAEYSKIFMSQIVRPSIIAPRA